MLPVSRTRKRVWYTMPACPNRNVRAIPKQSCDFLIWNSPDPQFSIASHPQARNARTTTPFATSLTDIARSRGSLSTGPSSLAIASFWNRSATLHRPLPKAAKEESCERLGVREPADYILCRKADHRPGDWLLTFDVTSGKHLSWMYVDSVVRVARSDKRAFDRRYPYVAVQVHRLQMNPASPPFKIDAFSRRTITAAVEEVGVERFERMKTGRLPVVFRRCLPKHSTSIDS